MNLIRIVKNNRFYESTHVQRDWLRRKTSSRQFGRVYLVVALVFLLVSTVFWSALGARVQQSNADQLADPLLFSSWKTFRGAQFPGSHTFLIKWPIFYLAKLFGYSPISFIGLTILTVLITVAVFVFLFYKIDRRPLILGTLCIMLGSALLLIPTVPNSGVLLPVNMAMLETRNLEYAVFVIALACLAKARRIKNWWFLLGVIMMGLLIASDKLFLSITIGGALIALVVYALSHGWNVVSISVDWLVASVGAAVVAIGAYWFLGVLNLTTVVNGGAAGPYGLVRSFKTAILGILYAASALLTNFGANPAFHTMELAGMPKAGFTGIFSWSGPSYILNLIILLLCLFAMYKILKASFAHNRNWRITLDTPARIALMLIFSTAAAVAVFAATDHYYAGDTRYLAIGLFAGFISLAVFLRGRPTSSSLLVVGGGLLVVAGIISGFSVFNTYQQDVAALKPIDERNKLVQQALTHHNVDVLAGDYWRTVPTRVISDNRVNIMPLQNCTVPRDVLTSSEWEKDIKKDSFAYLLSLDKGLTDFPTCTLSEVVSSYGKPNSSLVIEGTLDKPKELLLFYDNGAHSSAPTTGSVSAVPSTVTPITLDELPNTSCAGPTIINIVAHQDDDLLFMNPDIYHYIQQGYCIRTIYLTAGDAGGDKFYWLKREQGAQAAYDTMLTSKQIWINRIVKLRDSGAYATVTNPRSNPKVSLIFLHLPDGNVHGQGFGSSSFANLERLESGSIDRLYSIDGNSSYSSGELVTGLAELMSRYLPTEINAQSSMAGTKYTDHSDHMTAGRFAHKAYEEFEKRQFDNKVTVPFNYYLGYPVHEQPENVTGQDFTEKTSIFLEYAAFDEGVCHNFADCSTNPAYGSYLQRQYKVPQ